MHEGDRREKKAADCFLRGVLVFKKVRVHSVACDTAIVDNCELSVTYPEHSDSCKHPPLERPIKIKLVSCAP